MSYIEDELCKIIDKHVRTEDVALLKGDEDIVVDNLSELIQERAIVGEKKYKTTMAIRKGLGSTLTRGRVRLPSLPLETTKHQSGRLVVVTGKQIWYYTNDGKSRNQVTTHPTRYGC